MQITNIVQLLPIEASANHGNWAAKQENLVGTQDGSASFLAGLAAAAMLQFYKPGEGQVCEAEGTPAKVSPVNGGGLIEPLNLPAAIVNIIREAERQDEQTVDCQLLDNRLMDWLVSAIENSQLAEASIPQPNTVSLGESGPPFVRYPQETWKSQPTGETAQMALTLSPAVNQISNNPNTNSLKVFVEQVQAELGARVVTEPKHNVETEVKVIPNSAGGTILPAEQPMEPVALPTVSRLREQVDFELTAVEAEVACGRSYAMTSELDKAKVGIQQKTAEPSAGRLLRAIREYEFRDEKELKVSPTNIPGEVFPATPEPVTGNLDQQRSELVSELPRPKIEEILRQVVNHVRLRVGNGHSEIRIHLKPEFLGQLKIAVQIEGGLIAASFTAENLQVKQLLEANLPLLKQSLEEQGLRFDRLDVSLDAWSSFSGHSYQTDQQQCYDWPKWSNFRSANNYNDVVSETPELSRWRQPTGGKIDFLV